MLPGTLLPSRRTLVTATGLFQCSGGCWDSTASLSSRATIRAILKPNPPSFPPPDLSLLQRDILFDNASFGHVNLSVTLLLANHFDSVSQTLDSAVAHRPLARHFGSSCHSWHLYHTSQLRSSVTLSPHCVVFVLVVGVSRVRCLLVCRWLGCRGRGSCWLFEPAVYEIAFHSISLRGVFCCGAGRTPVQMNLETEERGVHDTLCSAPLCKHHIAVAKRKCGASH